MAPLKPMQAQYITEHCCGQPRWLKRLCERLEARGYKPDEPLMRSAREAYNAMHALRVHSMYEGMEHGVGKPALP
jgi:hypothetical protein